MPFGRSRPRHALSKRDTNPLSVNIGNSVLYGLYYVNASVGTPPQFVQLQIDTGSSDVWMFGPGACSGDAQCLGGTFDPSNSSTATLLEKDGFEIQYVTPGSEVSGDYISDDFALGGASIKNLTMAVATNAQSVTTGIMGTRQKTGSSTQSKRWRREPTLPEYHRRHGHTRPDPVPRVLPLSRRPH